MLTNFTIDQFLRLFNYHVEGGCECNMDAFLPGTRIMDFNNVSVIFDSMSEFVHAILITPVNDPGVQYCWAQPINAADFMKENRDNGIELKYINNAYVAITWARQSQNNMHVDLRDVDLVDLTVPQRILDKINTLGELGVAYEELLDSALSQVNVKATTVR